MPEPTDDLYRVQKKDIIKAGTVLADAFQQDPFWKEILESANFKQRSAFFESPVKYCLKYGEVYAPSEKLQGIAAWVPCKFADMTMWRALSCGSFNSIMKMGMKMARQSMQMQTIFEPLEVERRNNMKGRQYLYLIIIGVASEFQGQRLGNKMLKSLIRKSEQAEIAIYLETPTERNVKMYEKLGFRVLSKVDLPIVNLPQWGMLREKNP